MHKLSRKMHEVYGLAASRNEPMQHQEQVSTAADRVKRARVSYSPPMPLLSPPVREAYADAGPEPLEPTPPPSYEEACAMVHLQGGGGSDNGGLRVQEPHFDIRASPDTYNSSLPPDQAGHLSLVQSARSLASQDSVRVELQRICSLSTASTTSGALELSRPATILPSADAGGGDRASWRSKPFVSSSSTSKVPHLIEDHPSIEQQQEAGAYPPSPHSSHHALGA
jgi:hypothetical protein